MNPSCAYDPDRHEDGSLAARGRCSHHARGAEDGADQPGSDCTGEAVASFLDQDGQWQSACSRALEQLVERGEIEPLGQGA